MMNRCKNIVGLAMLIALLVIPARAQGPLNGAAKTSLMLGVLDIRDMDINDVLKLLAYKTGLNIIAGKNITGRVTIFLKNVEVHDALTTILKANDLAYMQRRGIVQILTSAEYEQITGYKFGVEIESKTVLLKSAKAFNVMMILNQLKSQSGKVMADESSNSVVIEDVPEKIDELTEIIKTMDMPTHMRVYQLQHVGVEALTAKLQKMLSPKIGSMNVDGLSNKLFVTDTPITLMNIDKYIKQIDIPRETKVFHINYAKIDDLVKTISVMLTKDVGSLEFDTRSGTLMLMDILPKIDEISAMIAALDKKDPEVFIEAKIFQITLSDAYQMGVNWDKVLRVANTKADFSSSFPISGGLTSGVSSLSIGTLGAATYRDVIQALDTFGKSHVLSSPRLAVINNQEASILIGTTTPYSTSTTTTTTTAPITAESVNFIDTGVKLHVTPTIHDDGFVTMKIKPEISSTEAVSYRTSQGNVIPIVDTSTVQTTVRVKDGVTIIIGGLMKNELNNSKSKLPILGDLPLVGKVFGNTNRSVKKTEIVIFLTPHVINGDVRENPESYKETEAIKSQKTYYNPLPKNESTQPVP